MRILGIDPGYDRLGVCILEKKAGAKEAVLFSTCLVSDKKATNAERFRSMGGELSLVIRAWNPEILAIEKLFFTKNQKTAMAVSEMRGVIIYIGAQAGLPIAEYTPNEVKTAVTGYGKAEKKDVELMVKKLVLLPDQKRMDDEYDAIAVALACAAIWRK